MGISNLESGDLPPSDEMEALRAEYASMLPQRVQQIEELWSGLEEQWSADVAQSLHVMVHKLAGTGASFGYPAVSIAARAFEDEIQLILDAGAGPTEDQRARVRADLSALWRAAMSER